MATDYSFFEQTLEQWRTYKPRIRQWRELIELPYYRSRVQVIGKLVPGGDYRFRVRHLMNEPNPIGVAQLNERLNITLPSELDDFYRRWEGGTLFFRQFYQVLSIRDVLQQAELQRTPDDGYTPSIAASSRILRFCHIHDGRYLALRHRARQTWEVMKVPPGYTDAELVVDDDDVPGFVTDPNFPTWLRRMCDTDGWPIGGYEFEPEPPPAERVE